MPLQRDGGIAVGADGTAVQANTERQRSAGELAQSARGSGRACERQQPSSRWW